MQQLELNEGTYCHYYLDLLLLFYFLTIQKNLYMIDFYLNLFYEDYNEINNHYQKQMQFLSLLFLILNNIFAKEIQKVLS